MAINTNALSSTFKSETLVNKAKQAEFRKWQAAFYSLRQLMWADSKGKIFRDAIEYGLIEPVAPGYRRPDGSWSRPEYDEDEVREIYADAWEKFVEQFDGAFVKATIEEIGEYSHNHFGQNLKDLLRLNDQRSAERFSR